MRYFFLLLVAFFLIACKKEQTSETDILKVSDESGSEYSITFENAIHHEATILATFKGLPQEPVELRMSRTSPGRYALHEFAKNVYDVIATNTFGDTLKISRPDPYSWMVEGHDGVINLKYTLYANHGDGTYSQIDETHAHLNMPATFMYAPVLAEDDFKITFNVREDLNWKIATQLNYLGGNIYTANDLHYFMDSPTEISNHMLRSFDLDGQTVNFALHHNGTEAEFDTYFENTKKIVLEQKAIYGELPAYDYGQYTFLGCYMPNVSGDGMEHRNSTILTSTRSLSEGGMEGNIGTVSHEFFHCWNVERIRPASLEPFDYEEANMSGELWFAEGFTSYYDDLTLVRAGIISIEDYIKGLTGTFNYVWNSPGRQFFNPIEMSYQAPFVDAARSVDDVNRGNTFISYYSYGSMLGLALDLSLRQKGLNLDDYMKRVWQEYGKTFQNYTVKDLHETLNVYAGSDFGDNFFNKYIYDSQMPDYAPLFNFVGVDLSQNLENAAFNLRLRDGNVVSNTIIGSSAYKAGLEKGDRILKIGDVDISNNTDFNNLSGRFKPGNIITIDFERFGHPKSVELTLDKDTSYNISILKGATEEQTGKRTSWLQSKR